jgi:hypothetical protein
MTVMIYHNPRCSKSRATLALLEALGLKPKIVDYLKTPPTAAELKANLRKLGMKPRDLLRTGEMLYAELGLKTPNRRRRTCCADGEEPDPDRAADRGRRRQGRARQASRKRTYDPLERS